MNSFAHLIESAQHENRPALIAMIHVGALPSTPRSTRSVPELAASAVEEARLLAGCGVDAILLENMHDTPYLNRSVGHEVVAAMTAIVSSVRSAVQLPLGVQILAGANKEALAVAHACGCQFVRAEGFVFAHVADEGLIPDADAGPLLRYRKMIAADSVAILADVKKKHSAHAITADVSLAESAQAAEFFGAGAVVVTGSATARPTSPEDLAAVKRAVKIPVLAGSGVTPENIAGIAPFTDAVIVGSCLKKDGLWSNEPQKARIDAMTRAIKAASRGT